MHCERAGSPGLCRLFGHRNDDLLDLTSKEVLPCSQTSKSLGSSRPTHRNRTSQCNAVESCKSECVPPCKQWIFKSTIDMLSDTFQDGAVVIWITYNPLDGILAFEEVPTYTWDTFLSNIGGQLGLWLGISAISVVQVMYYCGLACTRAVRSRWLGAML